MSIAETDAQIINPNMPDVPPTAPSKINLKDYKNQALMWKPSIWISNCLRSMRR